MADRYSAMNIASPWRGLNVIPDVTIPAGERAAVMFLYSFGGGGVTDAGKMFVGEVQEMAMGMIMDTSMGMS